MKKADVKDSNPKDAVGSKKVPCSTVPGWVEPMIGLGFLEGGCKYGRHNYRVAGVRASVYYDALQRHIKAWWEGEDYDPDTAISLEEAKRLGFTEEFAGLPHPVKAMCCLVVLQDAAFNGVLTDDRPPSMKDRKWVQKLNKAAEMILAKYPNPKRPYVRGDTEIHTDAAFQAPKRAARKPAKRRAH